MSYILQFLFTIAFIFIFVLPPLIWFLESKPYRKFSKWYFENWVDKVVSVLNRIFRIDE